MWKNASRQLIVKLCGARESLLSKVINRLHFTPAFGPLGKVMLELSVPMKLLSIFFRLAYLVRAAKNKKESTVLG